jgi:transposase
VRLVWAEGASVSSVARDLGMRPEALWLWVEQADIDAGRRDGLTTEERAELTRLRRENRVLKEARESLKTPPVRLGRTPAGPETPYGCSRPGAPGGVAVCFLVTW